MMASKDSSGSSMDESGLLIMRHIRVLQESSDREEILDAIEELRSQARGDGTLKAKRAVKIYAVWWFIEQKKMRRVEKKPANWILVVGPNFFLFFILFFCRLLSLPGLKS